MVGDPRRLREQFADELLRPDRWGEFASGISRGLEALPGVRVPYRGVDQWTRTVIPLGGTVLVVLAAALAFWPRRNGKTGFPGVALFLLVALYAVPAVALDFENEFLRGAALALLVLAFLRLAICGSQEYKQKGADREILTKAQIESDPVLGATLVPLEFVSQLIYLTEPYGVARRIANVRRMTREVQQHPRKTSIPTMSWVSEGTTGTVVNNNYDMVELLAKKLQLLMQASNELLEDAAISVADDLASSMREATVMSARSSSSGWISACTDGA